MANKLLCVILVCLTSYALACEKGGKQQLLKMQQLWDSQNSSNYSYVVKKQCFCSPDYTREMQVMVIDSKVAEALYLDTNEKVPNEIVKQLATISEWFAEISMAADNESGEIEVVYDNEFGFPTNIRIDRHKRRTDDEFNVTISNVTKQ